MCLAVVSEKHGPAFHVGGGVVEELLAKDKTLDVMILRHERIAESLGRARRRQDAFRADANGVLENELRAYVAREKYDLQKRAASAVCSEARADERMRDRTGAERERREDARAFDRGFSNGLLLLASALGRADADEGQGATRSANAYNDAHLGLQQVVGAYGLELVWRVQRSLGDYPGVGLVGLRLRPVELGCVAQALER